MYRNILYEKRQCTINKIITLSPTYNSTIILASWAGFFFFFSMWGWLNLIKNKMYTGTLWASIAQWLLASLCGLYCVYGLCVPSLCHIARCQRQLVTRYGFRSGGSNGFFPALILLDLSLSFSPSFSSGHLVLIACLIRAAIFHLPLAFVLSCFIILPQPFVFSFFLGLFFCHRHLRSISFSPCLALVLVFKVSVYPSSHF